MGCPTGLVTAVAAVFISPGALLTPTPKIALFGRIPRAGGVKLWSKTEENWNSASAASAVVAAQRRSS